MMNDRRKDGVFLVMLLNIQWKRDTLFNLFSSDVSVNLIGIRIVRLWRPVWSPSPRSHFSSSIWSHDKTGIPLERARRVEYKSALSQG